MTQPHATIIGAGIVGVSTADNIVFTDLSTLSSSVPDALSSTKWTYGDNTTGTTTTGSRKYANPGYYRVNLERTSTVGCRDSISKQIVVLGRFVANATSTYSESFESSNGNWLSYELQKQQFHQLIIHGPMDWLQTRIQLI